MVHKYIQFLFLSFFAFILAGCFSSTIALNNYKYKHNQKITIPPICEKYYTTKLPSVAVVDFTNNSNFPDSKALQSSIISPLEDMILKSSGANLITRNDFEKINNELKLQNSGILDLNTIVEFGKLSGVEYIITGSIDSVEQNYRDNSKYALMANQVTAFSRNEKVQLGGLATLLGTIATDGLSITTKITIKMIEVKSGKILFTQQLDKSNFIHHVRKASQSQVSENIKNTMIESLPQIQNEILKLFNPQGYIVSIKTQNNTFDETIAQINLGKKNNIQQNDIFSVYTLETIIDPITQIEYCDKIQLPIELKVSQVINDDFSWALVDGDGSLLKVGNLIQKLIN